MKTNSDSQNACLAGLMAGGVLLLLATLSACNRDQPQVVVVPAPAAAQPAVAAAAPPPEIIAQDDYVYYPQYEVYFSGSSGFLVGKFGGFKGQAFALRLRGDFLPSKASDAFVKSCLLSVVEAARSRRNSAF
jgi:hypothetical protein